MHQSKKLKQACFISLEGIEGVGKSSSLEFIRKYFEAKKIDLEMTREPGGTPIAESIRRLLLAHHDEAMCPDTEMLMLFASRAQHVRSVIQPALAQGRWVVTDRYTDASYAYQGAGRGMPERKIQQLEQWLDDYLVPDFTLLLDAEVEVALGRTHKRGNLDRFESLGDGFFERVRQAYLQRARLAPERFFIIQANGSVSDVEQQLEAALDQILERCSLLVGKSARDCCTCS